MAGALFNFDDGTTQSFGVGTNWTIANSTVRSVSGTRSLLCTRANTTAGFGYIQSPAVTILPSIDYTISVWVYASAATTYQVSVAGNVSSSRLVNQNFTATAGGWKQVVCQATTGSSDSTLSVYVTDDPNGAPTSGSTINVDNITVRPTSGQKMFAATGMSGSPTALAQWKADGGTHAHVPAGWDTLQASAGAALTLTDLQTRLNNVTAAGLKPILEIMLHYPPTWVQSGVEQYKDQSGNFWNQTSGGNADRNWVWTATGRGYVADLIAKVGAGVATGYGIDMIRIGGGFFGELHYPNYSGSPQWWGFSTSMQSGTGLASDQVACPLPGYIPFGTGHTTGNDTTWTNWYIGGLKNWLLWQIGQFKAAGFTQPLMVLHPGWGLRNESMSNTSWQTAACMGEDPTTMIGAYVGDPQVLPWCTWADASGTGTTETTKSASAKLRQVAIAAGKTNRLWCENVGGDNDAAMNGCFTESVAGGYAGFMWVDYSTLSVDPSESNLVSNIATAQTTTPQPGWIGAQAWTGTGLWADAGVPAPLTLTVTSVTSTRNDLSWTVIPAASSYDIERNGTVIVYGNVGATYSDTAATAGSTDSYRVRAVD